MLSLAITIGITIVAIRLIRKTVGPNRGVLQDGIPAQAKIVSVRQTGVMLNDQPQIRLSWRFSRLVARPTGPGEGRHPDDSHPTVSAGR